MVIQFFGVYWRRCLWVHPYFSSTVQQFLRILQGCFVRWEISDHAASVLWDAASRIFSKQLEKWYGMPIFILFINCFKTQHLYGRKLFWFKRTNYLPFKNSSHAFSKHNKNTNTDQLETIDFSSPHTLLSNYNSHRSIKHLKLSDLEWFP